MERRQDGGVLFKNLAREKETHPHYRGDITINGVKYWLSAWIKDGKKGKFMSLAAKPAEEQQQKTAPKQQSNAYAEARQGNGSFPNDEMPF